jgi:hypothetical protein
MATRTESKQIAAADRLAKAASMMLAAHSDLQVRYARQDLHEAIEAYRASRAASTTEGK